MNFEILRKAKFTTKDETSLLDPVLRFLGDCAREGFSAKPDCACVSGAGPVQDKRISITNAPWDIDGEALERSLGIPVRLINDFTAVSYGVLLLDPKDESQLQPIPHLDASLPKPDPQGTVLIVGAGTGLGVGYVTRDEGHPKVHPSEGGHIGLPMLDEQSADLWNYLRATYPGPPGAEAAVSGQGIDHLFSFLVDTGRAAMSPIVQDILLLPTEERPAAISAHAETDPTCAVAMDTFVDLYARVCADLCAVFLPKGGLYLAGGIAAKNATRFTNGQRFMNRFEHNYREHIDVITRSTPVYIVRDYAISLYGAAYAAWEWR
jgi:glucokinase